MSHIDAPPDPNKLHRSNKYDTMETVREFLIISLDKADPSRQETLVSENMPDPMDAEQTWPTNEEIEMAEQEQKVCGLK